MLNTIEDGKTYSRRVGAMTKNLSTATKKITCGNGYVTDESGKVVAQSINKDLPKFINIASGEDCYAVEESA